MILVETLDRLSDKLPQLGERSRERFARNAWWVALVIAVIMTLILVLSGALVFFYLRYAVANYFYAADKAHSALIIAVSFVNAASYLATLAFLWVSVKPLKTRSLRGWNALYLALLITLIIGDVLMTTVGLVAIAVSGSLFAFKSQDVVWYLFWLLVRLYALNVLLQIRGKFSALR